jgi:predicted kinase
MVTPVLVALKGFPGSGKSAIGRAVSTHFNWPLIDKDDLLDVLIGQHEDAGRLAYEAMWPVARRQLLQGLSVVCDSPLSHPIGNRAARRVAVETGATLVVLECRCSDEQLWRERVEARAASGLPRHRATTWSHLLAIRESVADQAAYAVTDPLLVVDTAGHRDEVTRQVVNWLVALGAGSPSPVLN